MNQSQNHDSFSEKQATDSKLPIAICSPSKDSYSESFIKAHRTLLPADVHYLYGGKLPKYADDETVLACTSLPQRIMQKLGGRILPAVFDFHRQNVAQYLQQHQIKAVLAEFGPAGVALTEPARRAGVPLVVHFHGYDAHSHRVIKRYGKRYQKLFKQAACLIAVSRHMCDQLHQLGAPREKIHLNPCGVDPTLFACTNPAQNPPVFIAVGRFVDKKGPHLTIAAFEKVVREVPEARLEMFGDGKLFEQCTRMAEDLGLRESVVFHGVCPHESIAQAMNQARAFVQHSVTTDFGDSEGTPVAVLEAGASGLPVIATRHAGIKDVVVENKTGLLVDEKDVNGMAHHMIRCATDPEFAQQLGAAARQRICENYSMEKSINRLWEIIQSAIATGTAR